MLDLKNIENLVFEGGGIRAIAFIGVLKYLEEHNLTLDVKRVIGSSAGCLYAVATACKVKCDVIENIINQKDLSTLSDSSNVLVDLFRLVEYYGACKGDALYNWYSDILTQITGKSNITFIELFNKTGIELYITGTNLNEMKTEYFSHKSAPTMEIRMAMRISTSIPLYFKSVQYNNTVYVDGGFLNNYPIEYFDDISTKTLGLKLMAYDEKVINNNIVYDFQPISNIKDYCEILINSAIAQIERGHINANDWKRSIIINTGKVSTTNFSIKKNEIQWLINQGYDAIQTFMN
jgi:NTE family protein